MSVESNSTSSISETSLLSRSSTPTFTSPSTSTPCKPSTHKTPFTWDMLSQPRTSTSSASGKHKTDDDDLSITGSSHKRLLRDYVVRTSEFEKKKFDLQIGKYIYSTNTSFRAVEHPEFKKLINLMRPGYNPPNRKAISGHILDTVYDEEMLKLKKLKGKTVSMAFDGWSNVHNEPIICASIVTEHNESYMVKTIDTSGNKHDLDYLTKIAKDVILEVNDTFEVNVSSFVTDNAANMQAMRRELKQDLNQNIITYGCSAHLANLLAHDLDIPNVKSHIMQIVKHVRNTHLPAAEYKEAGGKRLVLPVETRWNSVRDCLESYLQNWPILASIKLESTIAAKVMDLNLKKNAEGLLRRLNCVAKALLRLESDNCKISEAVIVWKTLIQELQETKLPNIDFKKAEKRYKQAITEFHLMAFQFDPRYQNQTLPDDEDSIAMQLVHKEYIKLLPILINLKAKQPPFDKSYLFESSLLSSVTPIAWWRSLKGKVDMENISIITGILTASSSNASVERVFSKFGLVHSKLRNKLGTAKAGKLVFLYKVLNEGVEDDLEF